MEAPTVDADGTAITKRWLALTSAWTEGPRWRRILAELAIVTVDLALATLVGAALDRLGLGADAIVIVYVLAVQVVSLATASHVVCGVLLLLLHGAALSPCCVGEPVSWHVRSHVRCGIGFKHDIHAPAPQRA